MEIGVARSSCRLDGGAMHTTPVIRVETHMQPSGAVICTVRIGTRVLRCAGEAPYRAIPVAAEISKAIRHVQGVR
jgi:hypothetical protein